MLTASMSLLPYISAKVVDDILRATRRLEQITGESWRSDWRTVELVCPHGVRVNHWFVLSSSEDFIRRRITAGHRVIGSHG